MVAAGLWKRLRQYGEKQCLNVFSSFNSLGFPILGKMGIKPNRMRVNKGFIPRFPSAPFIPLLTGKERGLS